MKGLDVSHWQGSISWTKVPLEYEFVIMKCTQGVTITDPTFLQNKAGVRKSGRLCGYYHFAELNDPVKEANFFLSKVGDIEAGELLVLDSETGQSPDWCLKFLNQVFLKAGFRPLLYINSSTAKSKDWSRVIAGNYGLWIASYGLNLPVLSPISPAIGGWPFYAIWQYSSRGKVQGVPSTYCDLNYSKMDIATLKKYGKQVVCNHSCPLHCNV